ncbi:MAG TPA: hypothetical protein VFZ20_13190, partial [Longimicrobium sp.]|nr:hypothetical protein [Longimicrobium sp.]
MDERRLGSMSMRPAGPDDPGPADDTRPDYRCCKLLLLLGGAGGGCIVKEGPGGVRRDPRSMR